MGIYGIGDLHLSKAVEKPMDIFGLKWKDHWNKIKEDWISKINDDDIILVPGDISWAMTIDQALPDINEIGSLPGRKILIKGNHDFWWSSIGKVRKVLPPSVYAIQYDSITLDGYVFCGTRGWTPPGTRDFTPDDLKIYRREILRLGLSLKAGNTIGEKLIVLLHYPPFDEKGGRTPITDLISEYGPSHVVYGHLHGESTLNIKEQTLENTTYHLVSCDYLDFKLKRII